MTVEDVESPTRTVTWLFIDGQDCSCTDQILPSAVQWLFSDVKWLYHLGLAQGCRICQNSPHIVHTWSHTVQVQSLLCGQYGQDEYFVLHCQGKLKDCSRNFKFCSWTLLCQWRRCFMYIQEVLTPIRNTVEFRYVNVKGSCKTRPYFSWQFMYVFRENVTLVCNVPHQTLCISWKIELSPSIMDVI